jgi:hypothetical protein
MSTKTATTREKTTDTKKFNTVIRAGSNALDDLSYIRGRWLQYRETLGLLETETENEQAALLSALLHEAIHRANGVTWYDVNPRANFMAYCSSVYDEYEEGFDHDQRYMLEQDGYPAFLVQEWKKAWPKTRANFLTLLRRSKSAGVDFLQAQVELPGFDSFDLDAGIVSAPLIRRKPTRSKRATKRSRTG